MKFQDVWSILANHLFVKEREVGQALIPVVLHVCNNLAITISMKQRDKVSSVT